MLPQKLNWEMAQTKWAQELNPLLRNQLIQGVLISNISITTGVNVINNMLSRNQIGFIITDINAPVTLYRSQPLNDKTLTLTASGPCQISVWCF